MRTRILMTVGGCTIAFTTAVQAQTPMSPAERYGFDTHCASTALTIQRARQFLSPDRQIDPTKVAYLVEQTKTRALASGKALSVDAPKTIAEIDAGSSAMVARLKSLPGARLIDERTDLGRTMITCALSEAPR